jgi:hypothetical protein
MMKQKQTFPCGHRSFGQFCHTCSPQTQAAQRQAAERRAQRDARAAWEALFAADPIDLRSLPRQKLVEQARHSITALANGQNYRDLNGKRLASLPCYISIPLGRRHRLIFKQAAGGGFTPYGVYSHETYNGVITRLRKSG